MKKLIPILIFAITLIAVAPSAHAAFDQNLSYGMANSSVLELQDFLTEQGCFSVQPTGFFGAITMSAVKCFQSKYGIIQTGYFGILSRTQANTLLTAMLVPSVMAAQEESSTTEVIQSPSTPSAPPTQYIYIPAQEPQSNVMPTPQINVSGKIPNIILSDIPSGLSLVGFKFKYTSSDFTANELAQITSNFSYSKGQAGKRTWNQYDIGFTGLPTSKPSGKVKVELEGLTITGAEPSGLPIDAAYITEIKETTDVDGNKHTAYTLQPAWAVEGRANPNE